MVIIINDNVGTEVELRIDRGLPADWSASAGG
jgi:hypothetical protein